MRAQPPFLPADAVTPLFTGSAHFAAMHALIASARSSVHLQVYILADDTTGRAVMASLVEAARRGVRVQLLLDGYASRRDRVPLLAELEASGGRVRYFEPLWRDLRFRLGRRLHVKVLVVDARTAIVGGRNIADRYNDMDGERGWCDMAVQLEGPPAAELDLVCQRMWMGPVARLREGRRMTHGTGARASAPGAQVCVRSNDRLAGRAEVVAGYRTLVRGAQRELLLMGSYFLPGRSVRGWLREAVRRGVEVHVVLTGHSDVWLSKHAERYLYARLLGMGVHLHEYLPTVLHAKCAVADGRLSTVG